MSSKTTTSGRRRKTLDERPHGGEGLLDAAQPIGEANDPTEPLCDQVSVGIAVKHRSELLQVLLRGSGVVEVGGVAHGLEHRPIRDALSIRKTTPPRHQGAVGDILDELRYKAGLPHAGCAEEGEELARAITDRLLERIEQSPPLAFSPDHRRVEPARGDEFDGVDLEKPSVFANCLGTNCGAHEPLCPQVHE